MSGRGRKINFMSTRRIDKINNLLAKEVANLFLRELELPPEIIVTVIGVDTSPDLNYADILISILPANKTGSILSAIRKKTFKLQKAIDRHLQMRPVPKIRFSVFNPDSDHLDKLFEEIRKEDQK